MSNRSKLQKWNDKHFLVTEKKDQREQSKEDRGHESLCNVINTYANILTFTHDM